MADNRMKDDELQRDMGTTDREGREGKGYGQQTPGRNPQPGEQKGAGHEGGGKEPGDSDDDEFAGGSTNPRGGQNRGGQNR